MIKGKHRVGCVCFLCKVEKKINDAVIKAKKECFDNIMSICETKKVEAEGMSAYNILIMKEEDFKKVRGED